MRVAVVAIIGGAGHSATGPSMPSAPYLTLESPRPHSTRTSTTAISHFPTSTRNNGGGGGSTGNGIGYNWDSHGSIPRSPLPTTQRQRHPSSQQQQPQVVLTPSAAVHAAAATPTAGDGPADPDLEASPALYKRKDFLDIEEDAKSHPNRTYYYRKHQDVDRLIDSCTRKIEADPGNYKAFFLRGESFTSADPCT